MHNANECFFFISCQLYSWLGNITQEMSIFFVLNMSLIFIVPAIIITFSPATYIVQDIIITILPYELSVECVFAMGSIQYTSCTVILVLDDIEIRRQHNFTGEWRFTNLSIGSYTVLVYDSSQYDIENQEPAVQRVVEVIGKPTYYSEKSGNIKF